MAADPTSLYKQSLLESAPPIKIVRLLYEKALLHMERARRVDARGQAVLFNETIAKADAIVVELRLSLDHGPAPAISQNLESLYLFCEDRLNEALGERDGERLVPAIEVLRNLLAAWKSIEVGGTGSGAAAA